MVELIEALSEMVVLVACLTALRQVIKAVRLKPAEIMRVNTSRRKPALYLKKDLN